MSGQSFFRFSAALWILQTVWAQGGASENLALRKSYTLRPQPNYALCTDAKDSTQLTDGVQTQGYFWTQDSTVGWQSQPFIEITVDLGQESPISGVSFRSAAGVAGVTWPEAIYLQTSVDGKSFFQAGELLRLSAKTGPAPEEGYAVHVFSTQDLSTHGRFVRFLVLPKGDFTFCDEAEVLRGPDSLMTVALGDPVESSDKLVRDLQTTRKMSGRFERDLKALDEEISSSKIAEDDKTYLAKKTSQMAQSLGAAVTPDVPGFKAILPLNDWHRSLFALHAELWRLKGSFSLVAWPASPYDWMTVWQDPVLDGGGDIEQEMMRGERRACAFNVANAEPEEKTLSVSLEGKDADALSKAITWHSVAWTDTREGEPVAAGLVPLAQDHLFSVPSGLVRQIWFSIDSSSLSPKTWRCKVVLRSGDRKGPTLSLRVRVHDIQFPDKPALHVGGWDYTDTESCYEVTKENREAFVLFLQDHFVDVPWGRSGVMPFGQYDADGRMIKDPSTEAFAAWRKLWPEARIYAVFMAVGNGLDQSCCGTPQFEKKASAWISWWVQWLKTQGVSPSQLALLLVDEPQNREQDRTILEWAKVLHKAEPEVILWEDPIAMDPSKSLQEMLDLCTVLCPQRPMFLTLEVYRKAFLDRAAKGQQIEFYSCSGPARLLDPYAYYRLQAWQCWQVGAKASYFWAFGDGGGGSSWNEYVSARTSFTPLFLDETSVTSGKQMEAMAEGVEDYEVLRMLKESCEKARAAGQDSRRLREAEALLQQAATQVLEAKGTTDLRWKEDKDRAIADQVRIEALRALVSLGGV